MSTPIYTDPTQILELEGMLARRAQYFAYVRQALPRYFTADGEYLPDTEQDRRITYWSFPALIATEDPAERAFALNLLAKDPCFASWNIFTTSSIAAILVNERAHLTPELVTRCEEHLRKFVIVDGGRKPSSGANDYMFHGYNDNMPAMATRAMVFGGEVLGDAAMLDHGRFYLEGLCAHFHRRGLLAEYNSSTYTPITLAAIADIAEHSTTADIREMAAACVDRILLDMLAHWHYGVGAPAGSSSRAYMTDRVQTISDMNAFAWYIGLPGALDPAATIVDASYAVPFHHGPAPTHCIAQFCELMVADLTTVSAAVRAYARRTPVYPESVLADMESGRCAAIQTRTWKQPTWSLGSASGTMWAKQAGQHVTVFANWLRRSPATRYDDRCQFYHHLLPDVTDVYDDMPADYGGLTAQETNAQDIGQWRTAQTRGSLLTVGGVGTAALDKRFERLRLILACNTYGQPADEMYLGDQPLATWDGESPTAAWHFLRFGEVYVGLRAAGMVTGTALPCRRTTHRGHLRLELPLCAAGPITVDRHYREWCDLGFVMEMADASECSFAEFRAQCLGTVWEFAHCFYRNSRFVGRHGELQIVDSIEPDSVKVLAVDGLSERPTHFAATGLPAATTQLFADGRRVQQRRTYYKPDFIGSPFYDIPQHCIVAAPTED